MIPSDHFVRFYNEIFKYLAKRGPAELQAYYEIISRHQETHCLKLFQEKGLAGCDEYWGRIKVEENVETEGYREEHLRYGHNTCCPSLSKVLDNDAGPFEHYCDHCPGWVMPLFSKCGLYSVYDVMAYDKPVCRSIITDDLEIAKEFYRKWRAENREANLFVNFTV